MALANLSFTNTFADEMTRINQIVVLINAISDGAQNVTNVINFTSNSAVVAGINLTSGMSGSYAAANAAFAEANALATAANSTLVIANNAYNTANAAFATANAAANSAAFTQANTATTTANNAYNTANAAFATANSAASSSPKNAYDTANAAFGAANSGLLGYTAANSAFFKANGVVQTGWTTFTANGSNVSLTPSSNASLLYFSNTGNIIFQNTGSQGIQAELTTTGVAAGVYGGGTQHPVVTVDARGRVTALANSTLVVPSTGVATGNANWVNIGADGRATQAAVKNGALQMTLLNPVAGNYPLIGSAPRGATIVSANAYTDTGTATVNVWITGARVDNCSALAVSSTPLNNVATGNNVISVGSSVYASVTGVASTPTILSLTLIITPS